MSDNTGGKIALVTPEGYYAWLLNKNVIYLNHNKRKEVITMPRTKGSKNRPKTNITNDYAFQITEKQEIIASLNTEIASIQKAIEEQKSALKKAEKEVATLEAKKAKADAKATEEAKKAEAESEIVNNT